jgi:beta-glucosidase
VSRQPGIATTFLTAHVLLFRWGSGSNSLEFIIPPIDAITSFVGNSATIVQSLSNDLEAGVSAAREKDVAFVFVNAYV